METKLQSTESTSAAAALVKTINDVLERGKNEFSYEEMRAPKIESKTVTIEMTEQGQRQAIAKRNIKAGEIVMASQPIYVVLEDSTIKKHCSWCLTGE